MNQQNSVTKIVLVITEKSQRINIVVPQFGRDMSGQLRLRGMKKRNAL